MTLTKTVDLGHCPDCGTKRRERRTAYRIRRDTGSDHCYINYCPFCDPEAGSDMAQRRHPQERPL